MKEAIKNNFTGITLVCIVLENIIFKELISKQGEASGMFRKEFIYLLSLINIITIIFSIYKNDEIGKNKKLIGILFILMQIVMILMAFTI